MTTRFIADGWDRYFNAVLRPEGVPIDSVQYVETRRGFYAGATHLLAAIVSTLDPGLDPTSADLKRMDDIEAELNDFRSRVGRGV